MASKKRGLPVKNGSSDLLTRFSLPQALLFILLLFNLATFTFGIPSLYCRLTYPLQVEQGEAINVEKALILLRGDKLYPDSNKGGPYLYSVYPPTFSWLEALVIHATGWIWQSGRLLALVGYLGCGILIALWGIRRWGWLWACILTALFLIFPTWAEWGTMVRCDTFCLLLHFGSFLLLYRDFLEPTRGSRISPRIYGAGLLTAAAVFTKQSAVSLVVVYVLACLIKRQWKKLGAYAFSCGAPLVLLFGWEQLQTHGLFYDHTVAWLNTGFDGPVFWYFLSKVFLREGGVLLTAVTFLGLTRKISLLLKIQLLFSFFGLLSLGRPMGAENYWLEFLLYGIFFLGESLDSAWRPALPWRPNPKASSWTMALFGLAVYLSVPTGKWPTAPPEGEAAMKMEAAKIYATGQDHLALDLDLPVMAGKKIWIQPVEYAALVNKGIWSEEPLIDDIRSKKFATIELYDLPRQYLLPQAVVDEVRKDYHIAVRNYGRLWLVPN